MGAGRALDAPAPAEPVWRSDVARVPVEQRFWLYVDKEDGPVPNYAPELGPCWPWVGSKSVTGYGKIRKGAKNEGTVLAHRVAFELAFGPIPDGLVLDHLCRVRHCVNPAHLEPVTSVENVMRGKNPPAMNALKTHCPEGHPFDGTNTYVYQGHRQCRRCRCRREILRKKRKRASR